MKFIIFLILFFNSSFALNQNPKCIHDDKTFRCVTYVKNYDGDTITFNIKDVHPLFGKKISVRVFGIDTPEVKTKNKCEKEKARTAQRLVANLLKSAGQIDLENVQRDKYFRILADVTFDHKSLGEILLKNGLAYQYFGKTKASVNWCDLGRELANDKTTKKTNDRSDL
jgi:micrococcal nuclease